KIKLRVVFSEFFNQIIGRDCFFLHHFRYRQVRPNYGFLWLLKFRLFDTELNLIRIYYWSNWRRFRRVDRKREGYGQIFRLFDLFLLREIISSVWLFNGMRIRMGRNFVSFLLIDRIAVAN